MKILMLNYEFPPLGGGGGVVFANIAAELARRHEVDVVTTRGRGLQAFEVVDGARIHRVPVIGRGEESTATLASLLSFPPSSVAKGLKLCLERHYDVINSHFAVPTGPTGVVLSRLLGVPNVLSMHGGDLYDPSKRLSPHRSRLLRGVVRWVLRNSTCLLAESQDVRQRALRYYGVKRDIAVIPWGLKEPHFEKLSRGKLGLREGDLVVISVGRLVRRKGLDCLLRALPKIGSPDVKLVVVGDGPERERLQELASELRIETQVSFLGNVTEESKFQYLCASDVFALPSLHEGFGLVFLEAMHCGLPIVTCDCGGHTDFLTDGRNGFLVPVGDVDAVASAISTLARDGNLRAKMAKNNEEDIERLSVAATAERYEQVFQSVAESSGNRRRQRGLTDSAAGVR